MNKLESFVENFTTTSLESSESACIRQSTIGMHRMHTSIDDQAQIASQWFPAVSNAFNFAPQNAGKCIFESLEFQNFLGDHAPRPP